MSKYTKGILDVHNGFIYSRTLKGGLIATCHSVISENQTVREMANMITAGEMTANACLFSVAPEMVKMLKYASDFIRGRNNLSTADTEMSNQILELVRKAEGGRYT